MSLMRFTEIWTSTGYPPEPVSETDLRGIEQRLSVRLPDEYRQAVLLVGLPRPTIDLLDAIVERELELHSIGDFYSPREVIEETIGWREIGMPEQLVAFASDGCGNKFCFDADQLSSGSPEGQAIWFYDHDFGTVDQVAPSFDAWIRAFCDIHPQGASDPN